MPNLNNKKNKLVVSELDIFLTAELGFFSSLKGKNIKFNPRFFPLTTADKNNENLVDLHLEIVKKIDELIEKHEEELQIKEPEPLSKRQQTLSLNEVMEIREPHKRKPEMPHFKTEIESKNVFGELNQEEEFFEIVIPTETHFNGEGKQTNNGDFHSWLLGDQDKKSQKSFMGLGRIKVRSKNKTSNQKANKPKKINNLTKTKIELEKTKREIEERKKALEEAEEKEKAKEIELRKKREEKKREEKLHKIELKKRTKEKKLKEKEAERAEKQKEKELKRLEQEKIKEKQIKSKEMEKAEKQNCYVGVGFDFGEISDTGISAKHLCRVQYIDNENVLLVDPSRSFVTATVKWAILEKAVYKIQDGFWIFGKSHQISFSIL